MPSCRRHSPPAKKGRAPSPALSPCVCLKFFWFFSSKKRTPASPKNQNSCFSISKGYEDGAVAITELGPEVADGTAEKVAEVEAALKDGSLHVFDTSKFTVDGKEVTSAPIDLTYYDFSTGSPVAVYQGETKEAISDGYFHEGELRAAPTFALRIDGIIEDADPVA